MRVKAAPKRRAREGPLRVAAELPETTSKITVEVSVVGQGVGTRGRRHQLNECGKVSSSRKYEREADDGGHDGHGADLSLLRHHVARPVRAPSQLRSVLPLGRLGLK